MTRRLERLREMIIRHRFTLTDLAMIAAVVLASLFAAWQFDVFPNETVAVRQGLLELDEIFAICAMAFALFAWSRLRAQQREVRRRRAAEAEARALAFEDTLTGLPNRRQFDAALKAALVAPPGADAVHAVFMLDLNGFKRINDMYGHPAGDEALVQAAIRLRTAMRDTDMVARLGGDEFTALALHLSGAEAATSLALRIIDALKAPVPAGGAEHLVGAGVGIALAPVDGTDASTLLRKADVALYRAKAEGASALRFFEVEMDRHIRERDRLERDLRTDIGTDVLRVLYAPRVDLHSGAIVSFEAAPQWIHPDLGELDAVRLFPIAENSGLTRLVLEDLLRRACRDALGWDDGVTLSFAIPSSLLRDSALGTRVLTILGEVGLAPGRLELEIPESVLVADLEAAQRALGAVHAAGIRIALTNFGTGYSSLYHLRNFKLDTVKIDRSFIQAMTESPESAAIVRALVGLGSGLGLTVAAEGVLDAKQQSILASEGCQQAQGALFSRTLSADDARALLQTSPPCADGLRATPSREAEPRPDRG